MSIWRKTSEGMIRIAGNVIQKWNDRIFEATVTQELLTTDDGDKNVNVLNISTSAELYIKTLTNYTVYDVYCNVNNIVKDGDEYYLALRFGNKTLIAKNVPYWWVPTECLSFYTKNVTNNDLYLRKLDGEKGPGGQGTISFSDVEVPVSAWSVEQRYPTYTRKAVVVTDPVLATAIGANVCFDVEDAECGNFSCVCEVDTEECTLTVFAKVIPDDTIIIPTIWVVMA